MPDIYLVDTSAWLFALRRNPHEEIRSRIDWLLERDAVATCGLVMLEILGGVANDLEFNRLRRRLRALHLLPTGEQDWVAGAQLAFSLRRVGITVPFTDALIAALAIRHGAVLLHTDRHFDQMTRHTDLQVESMADSV